MIYSNYHIVFINKKKNKIITRKIMPKWLYMRLGHGGLFRFFPYITVTLLLFFFHINMGRNMRW